MDKRIENYMKKLPLYEYYYEHIKYEYEDGFLPDEMPATARETNVRYVYIWEDENAIYVGQSFNPIKRWIDEIFASAGHWSTDKIGNKYWVQDARDKYLYDKFGNDEQAVDLFFDTVSYKIVSKTTVERINSIEYDEIIRVLKEYAGKKQILNTNFNKPKDYFDQRLDK